VKPSYLHVGERLILEVKHVIDAVFNPRGDGEGEGVESGESEAAMEKPKIDPPAVHHLHHPQLLKLFQPRRQKSIHFQLGKYVSNSQLRVQVGEREMDVRWRGIKPID